MTEVHTLAFGNPWWLAHCLPTIRRYTTRHALPLKIWTDADALGLPSPKFILRRLLQQFVDQGRDWCVWIDADVWIQPNAPLITEDLPTGFNIAHDPSAYVWQQRWEGWCDRTYGRTPDRWEYRNAGVWAVDHQTARQLLRVIYPPYKEAVQEQHQLNWWLSQSGLPCPALDRRWNAGVQPGDLTDWQGGHFLHLLSQKAAKWQELQRVGGPSAKKYQP